VKFMYAGDVIECAQVLSLPRAADLRSPDTSLEIRQVDTLSAFPERTFVSRGLMLGNEWSLGRCASGSTWTFAMPPLAHCQMSADGSELSIETPLTSNDALLGELIVSWILVYRLAALGRPTFHGSAIEVEPGRAVAVFGPSNSGKSSAAIALCSAGGKLISDDVVAIEFGNDDVIRVGATSSSIAVRQELEHHVTNEVASYRASDGRLIARVETALSSVALVQLLFLTGERGRQHTTALSGPLAVAQLIANSKMVTWVDKTARAAEFDAACEVADRVPAVALTPPDLTLRGGADALRSLVLYR